MQAIFGPDPQMSGCVAMNCLNVAAWQTFQTGPGLPLVVAHPARQAGPSKANPKRTLTICEYATCRVRGQALWYRNALPALGVAAQQTRFSRHAHASLRIQTKSVA